MFLTNSALLFNPNIAEVLSKTTGGRDSEIAPTVASRIPIAVGTLSQDWLIALHMFSRLVSLIHSLDPRWGF